MRLTDLVPSSNSSTTIRGITADSRAVAPGYIFVALKGVKVDGRDFIPQAIAQGAAAIVTEEDTMLDNSTVPLIKHPNPRQFFSQLAARFYTPHPRYITAVTGTNGKTSTAHFCQQLWHLLGHDSASIGTIGIVKNGQMEYSGVNLTTPDPVTLHKTLSELAQDGFNHVAMEASSHGLDQYRLDGVTLCAAGFTNLSRDHLDYHPDLESYFQAKLRLFSEVLHEGATAVLHTDIPEYERMRAVSESRKHRIIDYGTKAKTLHVRSLTPLPNGQELVLDYAGKTHTIHLPLIGSFQASNVLCALGLVSASDATIEQLIPLLPRLTSVPGRMEWVTSERDDRGQVFVDYSHTPDALEKALEVLRHHTDGKLWVVFGCGGDRDKGKRPQMGAIAARLADNVIVTDDNPRSEVPATIRQEVLAGCPDAIEIGDRKEAIHYAISHSQKGDIVLIAGKGHEKTQTVGGQTFAFDDVNIAQQALAL